MGSLLEPPIGLHSSNNNSSNNNNNGYGSVGDVVAPPLPPPPPGVHAEIYPFDISSSDGEIMLSMAPAGMKAKPCTKFFSTAGCPFGDGCHFSHYVPGGLTALGWWTPQSLAATGKKSNGGCGLEADPSLTIPGYKTKLCNRYGTPEGCRFGDMCHFAHGESDLRQIRPPTLTAPAVVPYADPYTPPPYSETFTTCTYPTTSTSTSTTTNATTTSNLNMAQNNNPLVASLYYGEPSPPGVIAPSWPPQGTWSGENSWLDPSGTTSLNYWPTNTPTPPLGMAMTTPIDNGWASASAAPAGNGCLAPPGVVTMAPTTQT